MIKHIFFVIAQITNKHVLFFTFVKTLKYQKIASSRIIACIYAQCILIHFMRYTYILLILILRYKCKAKINFKRDKNWRNQDERKTYKECPIILVTTLVYK